jgi:adenylate cyclase
LARLLIDRIRRHGLRTALNLSVLLLFLAHASGYQRWEFIERMEHLAYDARLLFTIPRTQDPRIVIVDIDEKSLGEEGRWPWARNKLARLVDLLFDRYQVAVVGFDVVFAEPDESSGLSVLDALARHQLRGAGGFSAELAKLKNQLDYDTLFADSLKGRPVILGYYFNLPVEGEPIASGQLPEPVFPAGYFNRRVVFPEQAVGYGANLPELQSAALGAGHFNPYVDEDGVVRRVPMLFEYGGAYYESLSLAVARAAMHVPSVEAVFGDDTLAETNYAGLEWLRIGGQDIPVDDRIRALVPYRGPKGSFPYVSASDVLHGRAPMDRLRDTIVLVGTSAPGLLDLRSAPVQNVFPGVEIHANLVAGILDGTIRQQPAYIVGAELVLLLITGLLLTAAYPALSPLWSAVLTGGVTSVIVGLNLYVWQSANVVLPLAGTLLLILTLLLLNMFYGFLVESRGKRQLAGLFGQYVPPELVEEMSHDPDSYTLDAESRELTVLFSDVRGFTTVAERLDPKELSQLMNEFLTPLTQVIHHHRGTIDKYMGDAIMAFWGAPLSDSEHSRHALESALEMVATLKGMQERFQARGWPEIRIGVGINTGIMSVGNMGSEFRMAYTVLGDAVNLGSRLEGLTRQYAVDIIVSESTSAALPQYLYRELDRVRVKGKDRPVAIYEPVGLVDAVAKTRRDELGLYREALKRYRAQEWDMAELQFLNLQRMSDHPVYRIYVQRIAHFRKEPPGSGWDGVFTFKTK